jgi:hypothetical protein
MRATLLTLLLLAGPASALPTPRFQPLPSPRWAGPPAKVCDCSPECTCGCQAGQPCTCPRGPALPAVQGVTPQRVPVFAPPAVYHLQPAAPVFTPASYAQPSLAPIGIPRAAAPC